MNAVPLITPNSKQQPNPNEPATGPTRLNRSRCPICEGPASKSLPAPAPWHLDWCATCQFGFLTNPPEYEAVRGEFEWERNSTIEQNRRHTERGLIVASLARFVAVLRRLYRKLSRRNKLLSMATSAGFSGEIVDIGCGSGHLWSSFPPGCVPIGIELSPVLAAQARVRLGNGGGRMIEADALAGLRQLPDASANGAIAISFLEHEALPLETLRELRRVLRPGGTFIVKLPNYSCWNRVIRGKHWCGFRFPDHVNYFTPRSLRGILKSNGFEITRFNWRDRMPTSDNMWCVARIPC